MNWIEHKLGNVAKVISGFAFKSKDFIDYAGIPVIKIKDIQKEKVVFSGEYFLDKSFLNINEKFHCKKDDILISLTGSHITLPNSVVGRVAKYHYDFISLLNQRAGKIVVTDKEILNNNFLYYFLCRKEIRTEIALFGRGGANQVNISPKNVESISIALPPYQTQKRIANILSSYDDLIENNLKRIKLLEQAAKNIYKEWFVNMRFPEHENTTINSETGLPEGWENDIIEKQIAKVKRKKKLKKDDYLEKGKIPIIDQAKGLIAGYTNNLDVVQDEPLPLIVFGDHTRRVKYINFPFASGADGTQLLTPINKKMLPAYFYLAINSIDLSDYKYARHFKYLKQRFIIIPNDEILDLFNKKVEPFLNSCIQLHSYNKKLKSARDILLPRLMNQTIEV